MAGTEGQGLLALCEPLFGRCSAGVVVYDHDLRVLYANPQALRLSTIEPEDVGRPLAESHPELLDTWIPRMHGVLAGGPPIDLHHDGPSGVPLQLNVAPIGAGAPSGLIAMVVDVSRQRSAEQTVREWAAAIASSQDAVFTKGLDGTVRSWNDAAEDMYGYTAEEMIGRPVASLAPAGRHAEIDDLTARAADGERIVHHETVRRHRDGHLLNVSLQMSPVRDASGRITSIAVVARDLSDRIRLERALSESEADREQALAELLRTESAVRSRIATELHDDTVQVLMSAIYALDSATAIARSGRRGDPALERALETTRATLEAATERTRRLMFDLRPAVLHEQGIAAAVRLIGEQTEREVGTRVDLDIPARRYAHEEEELVYRTVREALANVRRHADATTVRIAVRERDGELTVTVADDGQGFDVTELRHAAGAHMGITSMRERVRANGGDLTIDSVPLQGTRVEAVIPLRVVS